jgi:hypothetical protein
MADEMVEDAVGPLDGGVGREPCGQRPRLAVFADVLDRFLLLLVVVSAALGAAFPGSSVVSMAGARSWPPLAVLVFCTGASLTFTEIAAIRTASRRLVLVLAVTTIALPALAWLASQLVNRPGTARRCTRGRRSAGRGHLGGAHRLARGRGGLGGPACPSPPRC